MKIVIAGGTGFIGHHLSQELLRNNFEVCILSRSNKQGSGGISYAQWDGRTVGAWAQALDGAAAVVNLTGRNILTRWTDSTKREILSSRLQPIKALISAMQQVGRKPDVFVSASAVGYYGDTGAEPVTESHRSGSGFAAYVCAQWEAAARQAEVVGVRTAIPRIGLVLDRDGGALKPMALAFSLFAGGPVGSGKQYFPWIHMRDLVRALILPIQDDSLTGPYNVAAPEQITMKEFAGILGDVMKRPSWLPVPAFAVRLALGEAAEMVLDGQRVIPSVLTEHGFRFDFTNAHDALRDLMKK